MTSPNVLFSSDFGPMIINHYDLAVSRSVRETGFWGRHEIDVIKSLLQWRLQTKQSVTFYDVGAHIGTHSLALKKLFGDKVKIRAFEAQRMFFYMLCGTFALNDSSQVFIHHAAVSAVSGETISVPVPNYRSASNFGMLEILPAPRSEMPALWRPESHEDLQTVTIDQFAESVDFIKLDIEGMEDRALEGAASTIATSRPFIFLETHKTDLNKVHFLLSRDAYVGFWTTPQDLVAIPSEFQIGLASGNRAF